MIGQLVSETLMFESVDARTDGHRLKFHTISSPWAFGSGELINSIIHEHSSKIIFIILTAIVITVLSLNTVPITCCNLLSVSRSIDAVASSNTNTLLSRRKARARQNNWNDKSNLANCIIIPMGLTNLTNVHLLHTSQCNTGNYHIIRFKMHWWKNLIDYCIEYCRCVFHKFYFHMWKLKYSFFQQ